MKVLLICLVIFPRLVYACLPCVENHQPYELVAYTEPLWMEREVPKNKVGKIKALFDLSPLGKPINVKILKINPENLNRDKLIRSIQAALFSLETVDCLEKERALNKNIEHTFILTFDNML